MQKLDFSFFKQKKKKVPPSVTSLSDPRRTYSWYYSNFYEYWAVGSELRVTTMVEGYWLYYYYYYYYYY